jgi:CRISPR-associated endonuclease/helicase Cas3
MKSDLPWGKLDRSTGSRHHLAHHCADVAACFQRLAGLPVILSRIEKATGRPLSPSILERLAVIVFLHDAGKLLPGFQAKGWPDGIWKGPLTGHVREGAAILVGGGPLALSLHFAELCRWETDVGLLLAALAHHGRPFLHHSLPDVLPSSVRTGRVDYDPLAAAAELGEMIRRWFPQAFAPDSEPLPSSPAFQHLFCGLVSLADWIGSDTRIFTYVPTLDPDYMATAGERAQRAIAALRLDADTLRPLIAGRAAFGTIAGFPTPRPQQRPA